MTSEQQPLQPIAKEQLVLFPPRCTTTRSGDAKTMYSRRREQVRRAQRYQSIELNESASKSKTRDRNHRDRKKLYVKSMEDEVLRLQEEWAAVLQEIERATEENLILKDILRGHPLPISSPASSQRAPSGRTTSFLRR